MATKIRPDVYGAASWWRPACMSVAMDRPEGWAMSRLPKCNRPVGHDGEHVEHERRTFIVLARWS